MTQTTRLGVFDCYPAEEDDGLTLIDMLIPGPARTIFAAVARTGAPVKRIALIHAHADHIGCLDSVHA